MHEERLKIIRLADGRFLLVTERIVTGEELARLGISPPAPDVPWEDPVPAAPERLRRRAPAQPTTPYQIALQWWKDNLKGFDPRLARTLPQWLDEFGLEGVLKAFEVVKAQPFSNRPRYERLLDEFERMRGEGANDT